MPPCVRVPPCGSSVLAVFGNTFIEDKKDKKKDKKDKEKKDGKLSKHAAAVIGIALIAMGEDIGRYVKSVPSNTASKPKNTPF